jgi:hypothetical protein
MSSTIKFKKELAHLNQGFDGSSHLDDNTSFATHKSGVDCSLKTEEWLTSEMAALYLKVSVGVLRNMTSNGLVPYHKLGSRNRYLREDLRNLLLKNRRGVSNGN